ncbi:MAG: sugar ABC transporter permease [Oscillospiraceae bacterium]|nr:sugar ABC transporter permease [Oscillospiraceae bacterium]
MRISVIINAVMLFFPSFNPIRVSGKTNRNVSLFSCSLSYEELLPQKVPIGLRRMDWYEPIFKSFSVIGIVIIIGTIIVIAGACMSLGNTKLKKFGAIFSFAGGLTELVAVLQIKSTTQELVNLSYVEGYYEKLEIFLPISMTVFMIIAIVNIAISVINFIILPRVKKGDKFEMEPQYHLFLMMLPFITLAFAFSYLPLYGWRYAFFDYNSGETLSMDKFVGFKWFTQLFQSEATKRDIVNVLKNTLAMSGLGIATSWIPMAFAIFLSEIKNTRFRQLVQTFTTIPNFISWVLVYAIALAIFSTDGFINTMLTSITDKSFTTNYLMNKDHMWLKMLAWGLWKGVGWSAIIYIASISGIDQGLYEAATVDGAGRFAKMWYITVPELIPTFCVLLLMSIANILSNGMDQYLVFSNAVNRESIQVLDLYVYNLGIGNGLIPLSTVIGMVKSVVSVVLLFAANGVSKAVRGESIV